MKKVSETKNGWKLVLGVVTAICVVCVFAFFIQDNNRRAKEISVKSLKDATVQSGVQIDEVLSAAQNELYMMATLYAKILESPAVEPEDLEMLTSESSFDYVEFTNADGIDLNSSGDTADTSDREYFQEGMKGNSGITVIFNSKITNETLIVFYTPLYYDDEVIGVLTGAYRESKIKDIICKTFFDEDSRTFLCLRDGTIISSYNGGNTSESIFAEGNFNTVLDEDVAEDLRQALFNDEEYAFHYEGTNGTGNAYVMTLDTNDWMFIQTYPSSVTLYFIRNANRAGVILLVALICIFAVYVGIIQVVGWLQRRKLIAENTDKSYVVDGLTQFFEIFILVDLENNTYRYLVGSEPLDSDIPEEGSYDSMQAHIMSMVAEEDERERLTPLFKKEALIESMRDTSYLRYEFRTLRPNVEWDGMNIICIKRDDAGKPVKLLFACADVTKTKQDELRSYEALKEAYEAVESANHAKSDFLSSMSHDIRTPMNAIIGMTAIATINLDDTERVRDCLNKIASSSQHLLGLINEVLDMSKIESGKMNFTEEEFNLSDVVENIVTMFLMQTKERGQQFDVDIADITHEDIIGDSMRLEQVFINILGNAVKFTPKGGRIHFGIREKASGMHGYGCYEFTCEDTGIGMDEEFMEKLYEPFVRAMDSRTNKIQGTGLGMPIVKNLVQMMNGDIKVESKLNEGTKFTITVYLKIDRYKQDDVEELQELSVLVADDDNVACENACIVLKKIGMKADGVSSGAEAVERCLERQETKKQYAAVILDWKMPGMDGVETTREIRRQVGEDIPIIILSAYDYSEIEAEARNAGVDAFISKPLFRSRLVYVMKSLMFGEQKEHTMIETLQDHDYSGKRALLVEDIELNMEIAKELLMQTGMLVETAENGRLAVEKLEATPEGYFDIVFMDIQMPEMNGYEATAAIRASEREDLRTVPILAMSADVFVDDIKHAQAVGMNGHVPKPIEIENLMNALEKWL